MTIPVEVQQRYLTDPEFHARVHVGAQALLREWKHSMIGQLHPDDMWNEAKLAALAVLAAIDAMDAPEVEVSGPLVPTDDMMVPASQIMRRSGAKNVVTEPTLQSAFIDEARASMGQPNLEMAQALVGQKVTLIFNVDRPPVTGYLTQVIGHPSAAPSYIILDDSDHVRYPLNSIQQIKS
jgi:hypothetical protein